MLSWFAEKRRKRRAMNYVRAYPRDEPAARAIYITAGSMGVSSARQVAEITAGRPLTDEEWVQVRPRWERAWVAIMA